VSLPRLQLINLITMNIKW